MFWKSISETGVVFGDGWPVRDSLEWGLGMVESLLLFPCRVEHWLGVEWPYQRNIDK